MGGRVRIGALCLLLPLFVGCGQTSDPQQGLSDDQARSVYQNRTAQLSLPDHEGWPELPLRDGDYRIEYREKDAVSVAEGLWRCAWQRSAVSAQAKETDVTLAVQELSSFPTMAEYTQIYSPEARAQFDGILQKARLGDLAPMADDVRVNCS